MWAGRVGSSNLLYWAPHSVFAQDSYIQLGLHHQILLGHRRLLQRSETQRFSCLLARVGCAGFCTAGDALQKGSKNLSSLASLFTTTRVPPAQTRIFLGSAPAQAGEWKRSAVLSSKEPYPQPPRPCQLPHVPVFAPSPLHTHEPPAPTPDCQPPYNQ